MLWRQGLGLTSGAGLGSDGGDKCECGSRNGLACGSCDGLGVAESDDLGSGCADGPVTVSEVCTLRNSNVEVVLNSDQAAETITDRAIAIG